MRVVLCAPPLCSCKTPLPAHREHHTVLPVIVEFILQGAVECLRAYVLHAASMLKHTVDKRGKTGCEHVHIAEQSSTHARWVYEQQQPSRQCPSVWEQSMCYVASLILVSISGGICSVLCAWGSAWGHTHCIVHGVMLLACAWRVHVCLCSGVRSLLPQPVPVHVRTL